MYIKIFPILLIFLSCTIMICVNLYRSRLKNHTIMSLNKIHFKTGDLLLFKHDAMNPFLKYMFGDEFSHIGIVLEKDGELYICEGVGSGDLYKLDKREKGLKIVDLEDRLKTYEGHVCVRKLNKPMTPKMKILFKKYCDDNMKTDFCYLYDLKKNIMDSLMCMVNIKDEPKCISCSSFIIRLLKYINLIDDKKFNTPYCYRPQKIHDVLDSSLNFGYKYNDLITIDFDHEKFNDVNIENDVY